MTQKFMFTIWSEWDVGHENYVFMSEEAAKRWVDPINKDNGVYDDGDTIESVWNNYQGVHKVEVIP